MTERSLSNLYRRMGAEVASGAVGLMDAETLVAASAGSLKGDRRDEIAALLSRSPLQTDLVRMLRDLEPDAVELALALADRPGFAHSRHGRSLRHAQPGRHHPRHLRWAGLAACLMLVFSALVWQPRVDDSGLSAIDPAEQARPDRIFTSKDRIFSMTDDHAPQAAVDSVFQADFSDG